MPRECLACKNSQIQPDSSWIFWKLKQGLKVLIRSHRSTLLQKELACEKWPEATVALIDESQSQFKFTFAATWQGKVKASITFSSQLRNHLSKVSFVTFFTQRMQLIRRHCKTTGSQFCLQDYPFVYTLSLSLFLRIITNWIRDKIVHPWKPRWILPYY
jgi:hypothetical protein